MQEKGNIRKMKKKRITGKFKRWICMLIIATVTLSASGCAGKNINSSDDSGKISVVTTIFAPYDFARQIAGDRVNLQMLLKPGAEAHSYEPSPQDIINIRQCDIFIYVGGENDAWVDTILQSVDTSKTTIVKLLDCINGLYEEELSEGMESDEHEEEEESSGEGPEWDEHVWTSPVNAISICDKITEALCSEDSADTEMFRKNFDDYKKELEELDGEFKEIVKNGKYDTVVFGDRFPLRYFVEEYGLKYYAAFPGCASQTEASAATVAFLADKVKEENIPVVFKIELSNGNIAETIAEDTGAKVLTFNTCHNLTKDQFESGETYISLMRGNAEALKEALGNGTD